MTSLVKPLRAGIIGYGYLVQAPTLLSLLPPEASG
jgi:hypothetical protein